MPTRQFQPGFRLSPLDVVVLIVGGVAAAFTATIDRWLGLGIAFVVGHFFLFCNVLRMARPLELGWAAGFVLLSAAAAGPNLLAWPLVFGLALALTVILTVIQLRRPSYHGLGWQRLNPRLPEWWQAKASDHRVG